MADRKCFDAFCFISSGLSELTTKINCIIQYIQTQAKDKYVKITLGNTHTIVLEQQEINNKFTYYIYDPNHCEKPKALFSAKTIAEEIFSVVKRMAFPLAYINYLLDKNLILNCYVYPQDITEEKDYAMDHIQNVMNSYSSLNERHLFNDANDLLERYLNNCAARGIVISNIYFLLTKIQNESGIDLKEVLALLKNEMQLHLLSIQLMPTNPKQWQMICYSYLGKIGKSTLLHELAALGDIQATKHALPFSDFTIKDNSGYTPLQRAIAANEFPEVKEVVAYEEKVYKKTNRLKYTINYRMLSSVAEFKDQRFLSYKG